MSRWQLMKMTLLIASGISFLVAILVFWIEPIVERYGTQILDKAVSSMSIEKVLPSGL